ncbi:MAG: hypothetical protein WD029_10600 [Microthrixaceae bacterium]
MNKRSAKQESEATCAPLSGEMVFDRSAAERVMHRAIELAGDQDFSPAAEGMSEQAMIEAAAELGVSVSVVQQAAAEERVGLLVNSRQRGDALLGPAKITVSRIVTGEPQTVLEAVDSWLRKTVSLRRVRFDSSCASYKRRTDFAASAERTVRSLSGTEDVPRVQLLNVTTTAVAVPGGSEQQGALVVLQADMSSERSVAVASGVGIAALGSAGCATAAVAELVQTASSQGAWLSAAGFLLLGIPFFCSLGLGIGFLRSRGLAQVEESLNAILDQVATGSVPKSKLSNVANKLLARFSNTEATHTQLPP